MAMARKSSKNKWDESKVSRDENGRFIAQSNSLGLNNIFDPNSRSGSIPQNRFDPRSAGGRVPQNLWDPRTKPTSGVPQNRFDPRATSGRVPVNLWDPRDPNAGPLKKRRR